MEPINPTGSNQADIDISMNPPPINLQHILPDRRCPVCLIPLFDLQYQFKGETHLTCRSCPVKFQYILRERLELIIFEIDEYESVLSCYRGDGGIAFQTTINRIVVVRNGSKFGSTRHSEELCQFKYIVPFEWNPQALKNKIKLLLTFK